MGGLRVNVDRDQFIKVINELEAQNTYDNMSALQEAVANSVYGSSIRITPQNVYNYIRKWDIKVKTPKAARGNKNLVPRNIVRLSRSEKMKNNPKAIEWLAKVSDRLRKIHPTRYEGLIKKIANGSLKARIAANCITCCNGYHEEIKYCQCDDCPMFLDKPYNENDDANAIIEVDDENVEVNL